MSAVLGFTFGSFGDIITLIQLAETVRQSLSEARGSVVDCQGLISCLDGFCQSLELVERSFPSPGATDSQIVPSGATTTLFQAQRRAISLQVAACYKVLDTFSTTLEPYIDMVDDNPVKTFRKKFRRFWRKLRWASIKGEAAEVERRLTMLATSIIVVLNVASPAFDRAPDRGQGVYLTDLLDDTTFVPIEFCRTPQAFSEYLRLFFKERKGRMFVERSQYQLSLKDSGQVVGGSQWERSITSGKWLIMSALLSRALVPGICPNCGARNPGFRLPTETEDGSSEMKCHSCSTFYKVLDGREYQGRFEELDPVNSDWQLASSQDRGLAQGNTQATGSQSLKEALRADDIRFVKRIALIFSEIFLHVPAIPSDTSPACLSEVNGELQANLAVTSLTETYSEYVVQGSERRVPLGEKCKHCGKWFRSLDDLIVHEDLHAVSKLSRCPYPGCGEVFHTVSRLRRHYGPAHMTDSERVGFV